MLEDIRGKIQEKREQVKTRIEEFKTQRRSPHSPPKILAEAREKGIIPAIRDRMEAKRARRAASSSSPASREGEIQPELKRIREAQWR